MNTAETPATELPCDSDGRVLLKSLSYAQLRAWLAEEFGEPKFRADQIFRWLYGRYA